MGFFTNTKQSIEDIYDSTTGILQNVLSVFGEMEEEYVPKDEGVSVDDTLDQTNNYDNSYRSQSYGNIRRYLAHEEMTKGHKLSVYRQMSEFPEITLALNTITDEIITHSSEGEVAKLNIKNKRLVENINIRDNLIKEWEYIYHDLLDFDRNSWEMMFNFLVTGEIFLEKVINPDKTSKGLRKVRKLIPDNMYVEWNKDNEVEAFKYKSQFGSEPISMTPSQVSYTNFGSFAFNPANNERIALSYLEKVKKIWRQLQLLEEAVVIYRIVRAPEKRLFKIATGNMPPHKQEAYIQKIMRQYRQKKIYNTSTGEIDGQQNIMNMLEDYFFSQPETGNGSEVETIGGGQNLGEMDDVEYFLKKLYRSLQIPESRRLESDRTFNAGQIGDVTHQEIKFAKLTRRIAMKFNDILIDVFKTHLKLKGLWKQYDLKERDFEVLFTKDSYYEEFKEVQIQEMRMNNWSNSATYIGQVFSKEFACKTFLGMTDEDIQKNKEMIKKEKEEGELDDFQGGF